MKRNAVQVCLMMLLALLIMGIPLVAACAKEAPAPPPAPKPAPAPTPAPAPKPAPAPAPAPAPKVEKPKTIKVAYLADITGPYAAVGPPLLKGFSDYMEMINEKGGIDGVPIQVLWADTRADAALTTAAYKRFKAQGVLSLSCMVTPQALAINALVNEDKIPAINQSATLSLYVPPTDYMWCHGYVATDYDLAALRWFDTELWDIGKWGPWTLGILAHDNPFALGGVPAMYKYADTHGVKLIKPEVVAVGTMDFSTNFLRLVDAGADVIFLETLGAASGTVLKQMGEHGVLGTIEEAAAGDGKVVPFLGGTSYLPIQLKAAKEEARYTYGALAYGMAREEEFAGVKATNDFMRSKYGKVIPPEEGGTVYRDGWNNGMVMVAAIERAVKAVGWDKLNGETLVEKGLKGLKLDPEGTACELSYADYDGDRIAIQTIRPAAWDMSIWDRVPIGPCLNIPELLPEERVTKYTPKDAGPGWYIPK